MTSLLKGIEGSIFVCTEHCAFHNNTDTSLQKTLLEYVVPMCDAWSPHNLLGWVCWKMRISSHSERWSIGKGSQRTWCFREGWVWYITCTCQSSCQLVARIKAKQTKDRFWKHVSPHLPVLWLLRHHRSCLRPLAVLPINKAQKTPKEENKS